jgi:serine/threonine kinase 17
MNWFWLLLYFYFRGKFAQVRRCVRKDTNKSYAAKTIKKRRRAVDVTHEILHEIRVLLTSDQNERIVRLYEVYETPTEFILMLEM